MREILFKGIRENSNDWVEGGYYCDGENHYIIITRRYTPDTRDWDVADYYEEHPVYQPEMIKVNADTICQFTGIVTHEGYRIFENDIVEFEDTGEEGYEVKEGFEFTNRARVVFDETTGKYSLTDFEESYNSYFTGDGYDEIDMEFFKNCKVVGNAFDMEYKVEHPAKIKSTDPELQKLQFECLVKKLSSLYTDQNQVLMATDFNFLFHQLDFILTKKGADVDFIKNADVKFITFKYKEENEFVPMKMTALYFGHAAPLLEWEGEINELIDAIRLVPELYGFIEPELNQIAGKYYLDKVKDDECAWLDDFEKGEL